MFNFDVCCAGNKKPGRLRPGLAQQSLRETASTYPHEDEEDSRPLPMMKAETEEEVRENALPRRHEL